MGLAKAGEELAEAEQAYQLPDMRHAEVMVGVRACKVVELFSSVEMSGKGLHVGVFSRVMSDQGLKPYLLQASRTRAHGPMVVSWTSS